MHGYKNFFSDVELAFKDLLNAGLLQIRKNDFLSRSTHSHVILESEYQFLNLTTEDLSAHLLLIEKVTYKCINVKQLLLLNNTDINEQLRKYGDIPYEEFLGMKDMPVKEQVKGLKEHYCLGELYMYAKLVETVLYKYVFESKESWVTLAEKNGNQLYQAKINGLNI
jgi:hypothetical protein